MMSDHSTEKSEMRPCTIKEVTPADSTTITTTTNKQSKKGQKKRARDDSANQESSPAKKIKPSRKSETSSAKKIKPGPVCYMKAGRHEFIIKDAELKKSHTLHLLVNSDERLDSDEEVEDIYRISAIHGKPAAELNLARHSEATAHVAWLFLRNGNEPDLKQYRGKWDVGEELRSLLQIFPDAGALLAAAQLFDLGMGLRSKELQKAAFSWYQETRATTWSSVFAKPGLGVWVSTRWPEKQQKYDQYVAWLRILKENDPEFIRVCSEMAKAVEDDHAGLCADLTELKQLEPASYYNYWMSDQSSSARTDSGAKSNVGSPEASDTEESEVPSDDEGKVPSEDESEESEEE
ncbi:hypothetical protein AUEXF2481DRAFT_251612 [Aureobasidium subglaciale EXF-2481]|uniref:Uncharacterized protein n=1 Tax=Aureobasidium subglaciale (strain EXF-2481) TaxID=1043005 RepID=A0A074YF60_AURSE|nr:uncharacterized protein AUEXF2481DRAFT_251612 [Aureobasidium subglaciale EXF-2481]KAI5212316.1 hypothetical protein E4T38_00406 [Aureobasidium subglaciale]KAI5231628.1 hypothetical protein E4T40_00500 [Aureobasidium subglaciale]KAI5234459.1 hypothetical protein E4T41_00405 [Aureobasidium subglaciale]KAI5267849.1 hypothetical protein E4T46_00405 [Aureobasidium subglaciale]KEQ94664.1 hypothetical protein AUEXF2481DRAFT_251612 [Aureobasidium subglaciale EXF-2481]